MIDTGQNELTELETDCTGARDFVRAPRAFLILQSQGRSDIVEVPEGKEVVIGRGNDSTIALDDSRVSRAHACVYWTKGDLNIEDLKSRNGTVVNGLRLATPSLTRVLRAGDRLLLGSHEFLVALVAPGSFATGGRLQATPVTDRGTGASSLDNVVVADTKMTRTYGFARRIAASTTTALVFGETGSGKDVLVQQIHAWSRRADGPFIRVNCAALPESLVESEIFGHEKGAFTGATSRKIGFAEAADKGTLFLDEIGELSAAAQAKLLTMLENRSITRVGSTHEVPVDIRVIAATHRDLKADVESGRFREDLYYRLGVVILKVPPLRERRGEIPLLAELFARKFDQMEGSASPENRFSREAMDVLRAYSFPGNIRELRNAVEHAVLVSDKGLIEVAHLPETLSEQPAKGAGIATGNPVVANAVTGMKAQMADLERQAIVDALRKKGGTRTQAALDLGISLRSLLYKIKKYEITD